MKSLAEMTSAELGAHIQDLDEMHNKRLRRLRALQRCVADHEQGREDGQKSLFTGDAAEGQKKS